MAWRLPFWDVTACGLVDKYQVIFQASTALCVRYSGILTRRGLVVLHRRFGTACQSHFQGSVSTQLETYHITFQKGAGSWYVPHSYLEDGGSIFLRNNGGYPPTGVTSTRHWSSVAICSNTSLISHAYDITSKTEMFPGQKWVLNRQILYENIKNMLVIFELLDSVGFCSGSKQLIQYTEHNLPIHGYCVACDVAL